MTDAVVQDTGVEGADQPAALTDGIHLVVDALKLNGVETIYGVVGIPITDLARLAQASGIRYIGFRHESDAGHAAAAAGFLTQKPGICLTVSAPGFLNGLVALANATTNCFPMVQISGSSERHLVDLQRGDYEEMDQLAAAKPFVKAAYRVHRAEDIGRGLARAIRTAISGRPGGVYLDIPAAVLGEVLDAEKGAASLWRLVDPAPRQLPQPEAVDRAIELLAGAERPLLVLGKGAAYAQADDLIREFVESTGIPYLPMSMAKGLLPDDHPQSASTARSLALRRADVVMLVGARLNWLLGHGDAPQWNPDAKFVQVDIAATEMDSNQPIAAPLVGDVGSVMEALVERSKPGRITAPAPWREELTARSAQNVAKMSGRLKAAATAHPMKFLGALQAIRDVLQENPGAYVVNEGANALDLARNTIGMQVPRHRLDSGTWGVMGIGMGYAIAAAVETGGPVVAIEGDSAFGFSGMEIETVCRYNLPIVTVVLNNSGVYRGDDASPSDDPAPTALKARHDLMIKAFGGAGYQATTPDEVATTLREALAAGGPALIDCVIDPTDGTESGNIAHLNPKGISVPR
ncbi:Oxalyl-CoA decarboxylase [Streptomyces sp. MBT84]|uniref:oxalyl-CoA decarboxylase n=1 Tax=unclassified Streptomyces TaxID=2593676 RepID=UPI000740C9C2|nr:MULTISPECIES: oxalyl-CoA decarboxylase [unclassified Streptomyces]KUJ42343.1 oxalyl-CoA decarboxylase [Streptomyces sp. NRRL F-5122]MBW8699042.1 Oxalyl-CoA decarboxylase [Streptomyces sp. MBT84]MDX3259497.1 oxalyl-CoA decarboxylase [Streptomyces sp. MI02-2A]REE65097.1 oxalyl-CoA decarboxylase [Streptomyces sp. 3212.3]